MSVDLKYGRYCDECGRTIVKAHRVFENKDYCASCYPRVFVKRPCSACGASARVHKNASDASLCRPCTLADRVCIRCEKPVPKAGILSDGKPVCPSCTPHFRTPLPCAQCGTLSTRLSAMPSAGITEKICESCRRQVDHKTCSVCRKHRKVAAISDDGRAICGSCAPDQTVAHSCSDCGTLVPGSGCARCRSCTNRDRLLAETRLAQAAVSRDWVRDLLGKFAVWLHGRQRDAPNLLAVFRRHEPFFEKIDAQYVVQEDLNADGLLTLFGTAGLRKHLLPSVFLTEAINLHVAPALKADSAEAGRISEKLLSAKKQPWGKLLDDFAFALKKNEVSVRTMRLYISAAEVLCSTIPPAPSGWSDEQLQKFLRKKPGLRANLFKFVSHCRSAYGWTTSMPPALRRERAVPRTVPQLAALLKKIHGDGLEATDGRTLARVIAKALGLTASTVMQAKPGDFVGRAGALKFRVAGEVIEIPPKLIGVCEAYIAKLN
jgi:hypothetical protein